MMTILRAVATAAALVMPGVPGALAQESPSEAAGAQGSTADARALIEVLRDDVARAALLEELERLASSPAAEAEPPAEETAPTRPRSALGAALGLTAPPAAEPEPELEPEPAAEPPLEPAATASVGRRLAVLTSESASDLVETAQRFFAGLAATQSRLSALGGERADELVEIALSLLPVFAVTVGGFLLLRRGARWFYLRWGLAARGASAAGRALIYVWSVVVDAFVVVAAWALGYGVTVAAINQETAIGVNQSLYLNAFLAVELARVVLRAVLAPSTGDLRPVPLNDHDANYWSRRFTLLVSILGYGLLLLVPIVNQTVSQFTGRAVEVVVFSIVVLWSAALVIKHRRGPALWVQERAEASGGDATLRLLAFVARFWHWPALVWLASIFVIAVAQAGSVIPILQVSARVIGAILIGVAVGTVIARAARKGVRLPSEISTQVPMLEQRLNDFIQRFLGALRLIVLAFTVGFVIDASGLLDVGEATTALFGENFGAALFSVALIVTVAFLVWLAVASWVDWKLNPDRAVAATQREQTLLTLLRNAVTVTLVIITLMIALSEIGLDIGPLLASAGVLGLAIGFGAQKLVQDIITGVFIQLENAFNVGDVVTVAGVSGVVEKLTIRSVSLRDLNGVFHIIPFSSVDVASNFMRGFAYWVADFGVAYREDIDEVKRIMHEAYDDLRQDPEIRPSLIGDLDYWGVETLGDSAVVHRARIRTLPGKQWMVGRGYNAHLKKRCDAAGVEIPFPHMTLWFGQEKDGGAPPLRHAPAPPASGGADALGGPASSPVGAAAAPG